MNSSPNPGVLNRVRSEYLEMPGLTLKSEQVQRLCGIDDIACKVVLAALVDAGFLTRRDDGSYLRARDVDSIRPYPAKASLQPHVIASMVRLPRRAS
jgi:hypothetical protein